MSSDFCLQNFGEDFDKSYGLLQGKSPVSQSVTHGLVLVWSVIQIGTLVFQYKGSCAGQVTETAEDLPYNLSPPATTED